MNYRHAFHAGNHADVLKHLILAATLRRMTRKDAPLAVLDTHAGIGRYDLTSDAAARSPEWRDGIGRLRDATDAPDAPDAVRFYLDVVGANPDAYPGSPAIALALLRPSDRYLACELHPEDAIALRAAIGRDARANIHVRDGFAAVAALLPFKERRGLVLIDPPYEADDEIIRSVAAIRTVAQRFRQAVILWWRPIKAGGIIDAADRELALLGLESARFDLAVDAPRAKGGLKASSVLVINPPHGLTEEIDESLQYLAPRLAQSADARYMIGRAAP